MDHKDCLSEGIHLFREHKVLCSKSGIQMIIASQHMTSAREATTREVVLSRNLADKSVTYRQQVILEQLCERR